MNKGYVIILDGSPSAGKSTVAEAIQEAHTEPFLYAGIDTFVQMMPKKWISLSSRYSGKEGIEFIVTQDDAGRPLIKFGTGPFGERLIRGYINAVKGLAGSGNHVIADGVITKKEWLDEIRSALKGFRFCYVCLFAPLDVLEKREKARWEPEGMARGRFDEVYSLQKEYDLFIDTSKTTPKKAAEEILAFFD